MIFLPNPTFVRCLQITQFLVAFAIAICLIGSSHGHPANAQSPSTAQNNSAGNNTQGRDLAVEAEIHTRLTAINPQTIQLFDDATAAMDQGKLADAKRLYNLVLEQIPNFPDALRRLSYVEIGLHELDAGLTHAKAALEAQDSPFNHIAIASAMLAQAKNSNYQSEVMNHARLAVQALPEDIDANVLLFSAALNYKDLETVKRSSQTLTRIAPDYAPAHHILGLLAADDGEWLNAERELLLARDLGADPAEIEKALSNGIRSQARTRRFFQWGSEIVGVWLAGLALLFVTGVGLSRATLSRLTRQHFESRVQMKGVERWLRKVYQAVIALASVYFYISIPIVIAIVLAFAGTYFYLVASGDSIPIQLTMLVMVGTLYSLYALLASLVSGRRVAHPERSLTKAEAPQLWTLVAEVASQVGTRPVDTIYMTSFTGIAVMERGSFLAKLRDKSERCLILGSGTLTGMTQVQLKSILAHEYGHFVHRDTAGGGMALQVQQTLARIGTRLARSGWAQWYNPAWLFVNSYWRLYLRITLGASRLHEILADRYAALAYGADAFNDGLMHVVRQDVAFRMLAQSRLERMFQHNLQVNNLYDTPTADATALPGFESQVERIFNLPTSTYDSHPSIKDRLALIQGIQPAIPLHPEEDNLQVWSLFANPDAIQREMTTQIVRSVVVK